MSNWSNEAAEPSSQEDDLNIIIITKKEDDEGTAIMEDEKSASYQDEEMDQIPSNLLQLRAEHEMRTHHEKNHEDYEGRIKSEAVDEHYGYQHQHPGTSPSSFSSSPHHHHHLRRYSRSEVPNSLTDDGEDPPSVPSRRRSVQSNRASVSTISTVEDLRALYSREFRSSIIPDRSVDLPRFLMEEIQFGKTMGQGAFGNVTEIKTLIIKESSSSSFNNNINASAFRLQRIASTSLVDSQTTAPDSLTSSNTNTTGSIVLDDIMDLEDDSDEDYHFNDEEAQTRKVLADHCRRSNGYARFVMKRLRPEILLDEGRMLQGVSDLARETFFLKRIRHPNIIRLRAISYQSEFDPNYFLVLDRLHETLPSLLEVWRKERKQSHGVLGLFRVGKNGLRRRSRKDKLKDNIVTVCFELSSALSHLHKNDILYRDLKPANVGFDFKGDLRLFDFGLAKEITPAETADANGLYQLTQMCGTPRYMAPEVALGYPYGPSCDVYSFALLCWQMASLKRPYDKLGLDELGCKVWTKSHQRPEIRKAWPPYFQDILTRGWRENALERLSMQEIEGILAEQVGISDETFSFEQHLVPRRSTLTATMHDLKNATLYNTNTSDQ